MRGLGDYVLLGPWGLVEHLADAVIGREICGCFVTWEGNVGENCSYALSLRRFDEIVWNPLKHPTTEHKKAALGWHMEILRKSYQSPARHGRTSMNLAFGAVEIRTSAVYILEFTF